MTPILSVQPASGPVRKLRLRGPLRTGPPLPARLAAMLLALVAIALSALPLPAPAGDSTPLPGFLRWHRAERRVDADIRQWPLQATLERVAAATGWKVFVEPDIGGTVAARFENRPEREALAALFSEVNFALVPSTNGSRRLLVYRSDSSKAILPIRPAATEKSTGGSNELRRELVVRLKNGSKADAEALAKRLGARLVGSLPEFGAYRLEFDDESSASKARETLSHDDSVASVESNYSLGPPGQLDRLAGESPAPVSLRARPANDASTVVIALLDTGFAAASTAHSDFLLPTVNVAGSAAAPSTEISHGGAMFETIIQGLAIGQSSASGQPVRVLPVDIYGGQAETSTFQLAQGIVASLDRGADVLNMSLSGPSPSPLVEDVLKQASAAGVIAFAASGNEPSLSPNYPAAYPDVVAVTASDRRGQLATYANRGAFVDLIAPGTSVVPGGGESWIVQGTSVSTAYATGLAAGLLADSGKTGPTIVGQLKTKLGFNPTTPKP